VFIICILCLHLFVKNKVKKEHIIKEFNSNKETFTKAKDYCFNKQQDLFLTSKSYSNLVDSHQMNNFDRIFKELGYEVIECSKTTVTFYHRTSKGEDMCIIYSVLDDTEYGMYSESLGDNWYYFWIGYDI